MHFSSPITKLTAISPRRGLTEHEGVEVIKELLSKYQVEFTTQQFKAIVPEIKQAELFADNKTIPCLGASYVSGAFDKSAKILNSYNVKSNSSTIIFSPVSHGVCVQTFLDVPAIAINRDSVVDLVMANKVSGEVVVEQVEFDSENILVGNTGHPKTITFAHYDCVVGAGAVDNAGSVDVIFQTIIDHPERLKDNLFVFAGCEEESVSSKEGFHGFEMFDKKYAKLIDNAEKIIVLDGVGVGKPTFVKDHLDWVFGISRIGEISSKVMWMQNDQTLVMKYYHSELDTLEILHPEYLKQAEELLLSEV